MQSQVLCKVEWLPSGEAIPKRENCSFVLSIPPSTPNRLIFLTFACPERVSLNGKEGGLAGWCTGLDDGEFGYGFDRCRIMHMEEGWLVFCLPWDCGVEEGAVVYIHVLDAELSPELPPQTTGSTPKSNFDDPYRSLAFTL